MDADVDAVGADADACGGGVAVGGLRLFRKERKVIDAPAAAAPVPAPALAGDFFALVGVPLLFASAANRNEIDVPATEFVNSPRENSGAGTGAEASEIGRRHALCHVIATAADRLPTGTAEHSIGSGLQLYICNLAGRAGAVT
jgi:hypothetical protein